MWKFVEALIGIKDRSEVVNFSSLENSVQLEHKTESQSSSDQAESQF